MEVKEILYFDEPARSNTDEMVEFAIKRLEALGIHRIIIAWSTGYTLSKFLEMTKNTKLKLDITVVTNPKGGSIRGMDVSIPDETREELEKKGIKVCYTIDDLNFGEPYALQDKQSSNRAMLIPFGIPEHLRPLDINTGTDLSLLTTISQGFRVCVGTTVIAVRHGLIPEGEKVLAFAGKATALVLQAGSSAKKCFVKEILGFERNSDWDSVLSKSTNFP